MTVSKEIAQRLVGAGIVVESEKEWVTPHFKDNSICLTKQCYLENIDNFMAITFPAPNSDELLAALKGRAIDIEMEKNGSFGVSTEKRTNDWICIDNESLPNALALLALKLAEDGLLKGAR